MILFHSPKGGVGSTVAAANLALSLARRGMDVTIADLTGQGMLGIYLGGSPDGRDHDFRRGEDRTVVLAGVRLISFDRRRPVDQLIAELAQYDHNGNVLIVDLASSDRTMLDLLCPRADLRLCVLAPEPATLALVPQAFAAPLTPETDPTLFILNRIDGRLRLSRDISDLMRELLGDRLIGGIRRDEAVNEAAAMMETLSRYAPTSAALADFDTIADQISARFVSQTARGAA